MSGVSDSKKKLETNIDDILNDFGDDLDKRKTFPKHFQTLLTRRSITTILIKRN